VQQVFTRRPASADRTARCHILPTGVSPFAFRYQGNGATPANILIPLERQLIALQLCRWQFLFLQQTSRPLLSKLS